MPNVPVVGFEASEHHIFVVAQEVMGRKPIQPAHQQIDDLYAVGPAIDVVTEIDDLGRGVFVLQVVKVADVIVKVRQQIDPSVDVADGINNVRQR